MLKGKSVLEPMDLTVEEMEDLFETADDIIADPEKYAHIADGKIMGTLFYEPSTRTRLSFTSAMLRLGGSVMGFSDAASSSVSKGESIADTIRTVGCFADVIVMRHPKEGAPRVAAEHSYVPVINAGDGGHQHPSQTLTDLMTIREYKGRLNNLTIGLCGDLMFGRTVHSLIKALSRCENITLKLISPEELVVPPYIRKSIIEKNGMQYEEVRHMEDVLPELDVLYMTRVQKERFFNEDDYVRLKDSFILDGNKMKLAKDDMIIMHPLPRVNEIATEVDEDPRAHYFDQVRLGMYVRMALVMKILGLEA
ncbi:MAG: aspartate carbamoyltransferase [Anaerovoracaceae bacterium]|nr:aspartate carbamoyltransferase [Bacillota bacterium]MDY2670587.1 aspartate carbamoyltransferase [Anaerovoracaceae bacterium]